MVISRLSVLYEALSKPRRRELLALVQNDEWRFDIVGNLPLELVASIFAKLSTYNTFSLQRVSRRWLDILSSDLIAGSRIKLWRSLGDFELTLPEYFSPASVKTLAAEHEEAFRTGRYFFNRRVNVNIMLSGYPPGRHYRYGEGHMACLKDGCCDTINVYHIKSGSGWVVVSPERESFDFVAVSSKLVVGSTQTGRCYVWAHSHHDEDPFTVRLPTVHIAALDASDDTVAILVHHSWHGEKVSRGTWNGSVVTYKHPPNVVDTFGTSIGHNRPARARIYSFPLELNAFPLRYKILTSSKSSTVTVVITVESQQSLNPLKNILRVYFGQFELKGRSLFEDYMPTGPASRDFAIGVNETSNHGSETMINVWFASHHHDHPEVENEETRKEWLHYVHAQYNQARRELELRTRKTLSIDLVNISRQVLLVLKGIAYFGNEYVVTVLDLESETYVDCTTGPATQVDMLKPLFCGDEIYLVCLDREGFSIRCFDKYSSMCENSQHHRSERLERPHRYNLNREKIATSYEDCG